MPTIADAPPYAGLTPDCVLDALDSVGIRGDGRLLALNSYENRVYQAWRDDAPPAIAKFYRPARWSDAQILEEHALIAELASADVPAVAPMRLGERTLHAFNGFRFAVFPRHGGRAPELDRRDTLTQLGRYIARLHTVGAARPFEYRPTLDVESFGDESRTYLLEHGFLPDDLREPWLRIVDLALDAVRRAFARVHFDALRLHGDCHGGNVLWTDDGPHFVDFDDARMGPALQDLWMLLSGDRAAMESQLVALLEGYESFRDFDRRELALVEPLRTLRLLHYSAWIARRWGDPAFPAAFPWFGTQRYWQDRILELREQVGLMDEPPLRG
ncbi:MAG TPA: serine/threonine protein kinase [Casimicrobiaceae bacterium]|nr:serine/threonine protein kinase [Casimicrobiaceae bacterium]